MKIEIDTKDVKKPMYIDVNEADGTIQMNELDIFVDKDKDFDSEMFELSKFITEHFIKRIPEEARDTQEGRQAIFDLLREYLRSDIVGGE